MKKHSYGKLIGMSFNWMAEILFRPFNLKKWIMFAVITILAGQLGGGFNFNLGGNRDNLDKIIRAVRGASSVSNNTDSQTEPAAGPDLFGALREAKKLIPRPEIGKKISDLFKDPKKISAIVFLIVPFILLLLLVIIIWMWVKANFSMVFIDSVVRNDASLRVPFHKNKPQGKSFFLWSMAFSAIVILVLGSIIYCPIAQLIKAGAFQKQPIDPAQIISVLIYYLPFLIASIVLFGLISVLVYDFVLPIMYKKKTGILEAWVIFFDILRKNLGEIFLYLLVKIGLAILAVIASIIIAILGIIALIVIGGIVVLLGFLIYFITPAAAKGPVLAVLVVAGIPAFAYLGFLFNVLFIPIPVFFRIFSVYVLSSIDESLDLFTTKTPEEIMLEGNVEKYRKSMRLVWFAVFSPFLIAVFAIVLAVAISSVMGIKLQSKKGPRGLSSLKDIPEAISSLSKKADELEGDVMIIYLKNGNSFEAVIMSESDDNIAFKIKGGTVVYPRSDILRIENKGAK